MRASALEEKEGVEELTERPLEGEQVPKMQRNKFILLALLGIGGIALIVGLSVGLSRRRKDLPSYPTFDVNLTQIGPESFTPYGSCEELRADLIEAAKYLANIRIDSDARAYYHQDYRSRGCVSCQFGEPEIMNVQIDSTSTGSSSKSPPPSDPLPDLGGEDSFQTNNQVEGVDEADIVKSNGVHVFAAYGHEVVTIDASTVKVLNRTPIPVLVANDGTIDFEESTAGTSSGYSNGPDFSCDSSIASMLLFRNRLVVIATGYCHFYGSAFENYFLSNRASTTVFVYDILSIPEDGASPLSLVGKNYLQGYYISARSIQESAHIVTTSYVNSYRPFTQYMDRYNSRLYSHRILENEYRTKAHEMAKQSYELFVDSLLENLKSSTNDDTCSSFLRLSALQSSEKADGSSDQLEFTGNGIMSSMSLITSFNMTAEPSLGGAFQLSTSAMMLPTSSWTIYASQQHLVLAGKGWREEINSDWKEETYLIGYRLQGASSQALSIGRVPGYVLNQFSIDHLKKNGTDYLRIATTNSARWGLVSQNPREWGQAQESSSQVTVLEIPAKDSENRNMKLVGEVTDIGRTERIYSVRFLGDRAFVVTFRQVDPFYTLNMTDPTNPRLVGELKIPGFSNYLHPVGDDLILGVGQHADENTGRVSGLQVSLFDVSNFSDPQRIHNYIAEDSDDAYSSSEVQYDHRAFRFLEQSQVLILPVEISSWSDDVDGFDGFYIYNVDREAGISPRFSIVHADFHQIRYGCWSWRGYFQPRSLVFSGNVMTLKGHTILSHDLETNLTVAPLLNLDANLPDSECTTGYYAS